MPRFRVQVLVLGASLLVLAGCASGPGLDKSNSQRRTVAPAAATGSTDPSASATPNKPVDPAFAAERLRLVNPCALIEKEVLQPIGTPAQKYTNSAYTKCSNTVKTQKDGDISVAVELAATVPSYEAKKATKTIAGLKGSEQKLTSACFITAMTQENPPMAVKVQINARDKNSKADNCAIGTKVMEGVVRRIKGNPSKYQPLKGSPLEVDPCTVIDRSVFSETLGSASPRVQAFGLHQCGWYGGAGQAELAFLTTNLPRDNKFRDNQVEVDLGGVKGYQIPKLDTSFPSCELVVIRTQTQDGAAEIAEFTVGGLKDKTFDRCAAVVAFAKAVLPRLPAA